MTRPAVFLLLSTVLSFTAFAFQQPGPARISTLSNLPTTAGAKFETGSNAVSSGLFSAHFASDPDGTDASAIVSIPRRARNRLRKATGFSFTVFRATLRGVTGVSLTALYAGALAASGLWIRKTMSVLLSVFPSGFRYFLQPFLVLYYTPLILLKSLTSPNTRKRAVAKHETVLEAWKEAVTVAERTEKDGYWPVVVNDDGYFELTKPPSVEGVLAAKTTSEDGELAEAMAATVEQAMEVNQSGVSDDSNSDDKGDETKT